MRVKQVSSPPAIAAAIVGTSLWATALMGIAILFGGLLLACF